MDGEKPKKVIGGLASVYDKYTDMGWHLEVVRRGFFDGIDTTQTAALKNHDPNLILGRTANGTLTLKDTPDGYDYEAIVPDTQVGRDTYEEVSGGYIYQSSFAFTVTSSVWREVDRSELAGIIDEQILNKVSYGGKVDIRELVKGGKLYDVSPVTFPAYQSATSEARSLIEERNAFLGNVRQLDERAKVKIEIEVDTSDNPESETPDETPDETTASTRDTNNRNIRLRMAIAKGNTLTQ